MRNYDAQVRAPFVSARVRGAQKAYYSSQTGTLDRMPSSRSLFVSALAFEQARWVHACACVAGPSLASITGDFLCVRCSCHAATRFQVSSRAADAQGPALPTTTTTSVPSSPFGDALTHCRRSCHPCAAKTERSHYHPGRLAVPRRIGRLRAPPQGRFAWAVRAALLALPQFPSLSLSQQSSTRVRSNSFYPLTSPWTSNPCAVPPAGPPRSPRFQPARLGRLAPPHRAAAAPLPHRPRCPCRVCHPAYVPCRRGKAQLCPTAPCRSVRSLRLPGEKIAGGGGEGGGQNKEAESSSGGMAFRVWPTLRYDVENARPF